MGFCAFQTHPDYEPAVLVGDSCDGELSAAIAAEIEIQRREEAWLFEDNRHDSMRREMKKRKAGGVLYRQASWRWLVELDNMLRMPPFDFGGLKRFQVPENWESVQGDACLQWPCLLLSADQGPGAWTGQSWMESPAHGRINMVREPDSHNHGLHNDALGAVMDIGFGGFLHSATVVLNFHFMPWNNGSFGKKITQAADSLRRYSSPSHPIFARFADAIGKGFCDVDLASPLAAGRIWASFLDSASFSTSGQKVGMCRWFQVFVSMKRLFLDWTSILVVLIRANLDEPWMKSQVFGAGAEPVELGQNVPGVSERRVKTKCSVVEEIRELRKAVRNAMHFAITLLSTPVHRRMAGLLVKCTGMVQQWYHEQATTLKSSEANVKWMTEQRAGGFWAPLRKTFAAFLGSSLLDDLGFKLSFEPESLRVISTDASLCDDEFIAMQFGRFVQALVKRRVFRSAWVLFGWPGRLGMLLDSRFRLKACEELRAHSEAYDQAQLLGTKYLASRCSRSAFRLPCVRQIVEPLKANGWRVTDAILDKLRAREGGFKQSRIVENGFLKAGGGWRKKHRDGRAECFCDPHAERDFGESLRFRDTQLGGVSQRLPRALVGVRFPSEGILVFGVPLLGARRPAAARLGDTFPFVLGEVPLRAVLGERVLRLRQLGGS